MANPFLYFETYYSGYKEKQSHIMKDLEKRRRRMFSFLIKISFYTVTTDFRMVLNILIEVIQSHAV